MLAHIDEKEPIARVMPPWLSREHMADWIQ